MIRPGTLTGLALAAMTVAACQPAAEDKAGTEAPVVAPDGPLDDAIHAEDLPPDDAIPAEEDVPEDLHPPADESLTVPPQ